MECEQRQSGFRNLIQTQKSATRRNVQAAFDEAGEQIARHGPGRECQAEQPGVTEQRGDEHCHREAEKNAAPGFAATKQGASVQEVPTPIDGCPEAIAEKALPKHGRAVSGEQQEQEADRSQQQVSTLPPDLVRKDARLAALNRSRAQ